jgi:putative ABC transport system ATP-binding protein
MPTSGDTSHTRTAPPQGDCVFTVRQLTKVYGSGAAEVRALNGVDLDLHAGELVVLLGASGSGKSTLLNILGGLDSPTTGELSYRGSTLTELEETELTRYRRDSVGFVFQFYNLIPSLTARENVGLITEISRDPMEPEEALGLVGLSSRLDLLDHLIQRREGILRGGVPLALRLDGRPGGHNAGAATPLENLLLSLAGNLGQQILHAEFLAADDVNDRIARPDEGF